MLPTGAAGVCAGRVLPTPAAPVGTQHAEAMFTAQLEKATAQEFYVDLKTLVAAVPII